MGSGGRLVSARVTPQRAGSERHKSMEDRKISGVAGVLDREMNLPELGSALGVSRRETKCSKFRNSAPVSMRTLLRTAIIAFIVLNDRNVPGSQSASSRRSCRRSRLPANVPPETHTKPEAASRWPRHFRTLRFGALNCNDLREQCEMSHTTRTNTGVFRSKAETGDNL
jgi:hypothetical protein